MATAADLIRRAMKLLGVLAAGESMKAEDAADGLTELNLVLGSWANERLLVHGTRRDEYAVTSGSPQTLGVGGTVNAVRPLRIDRAGLIRSGQTNETPLLILTDAQYAEIPDKDTADSLPTRVWVEWTHPLARLWLWPVLSGSATLVLYTWSRIAAFAAADTVDLPPGYEDALAHALALKWAPMYGAEPSGLLLQNAAEAIASVKRTNMQTPLSEVDPALRSGGSFNIYNGDA